MTKVDRKKIIAVSIIAFVLVAFTIFGRLIYTAVNDGETSSNVSVTEYDNLFIKQARTNLKILATVDSRSRLPVSTYIYDNAFNVCVYKMLLNKDASLKSIVNYQVEPSSKSLNAVYSQLPAFNFELHIKQGKSVRNIHKLYFDFDGDFNNKSMINDSLYYYYLKFKSLSIRYNDTPYDIIANTRETQQLINIAFVRRKSFIYIILMSSKTTDKPLQSNQLSSIINKY